MVGVPDRSPTLTTVSRVNVAIESALLTRPHACYGSSSSTGDHNASTHFMGTLTRLLNVVCHRATRGATRAVVGVGPQRIHSWVFTALLGQRRGATVR